MGSGMVLRFSYRKESTGIRERHSIGVIQVNGNNDAPNGKFVNVFNMVGPGKGNSFFW
jgi:hypothetical protein